MKLNEFYCNAEQMWELIYKATRDCFSVEDFHRCFDNEGPTMNTIQSKNEHYLLGGDAHISWTRCGQCKYGPTTFLFALKNPHGIQSCRFYQNPDSQWSVGHAKADDPCFGGSINEVKKQIRDLWIGTNSNNNENSTSEFPISYIDTPGKDKMLFTRATNFIMEEIEVCKRLDGENHCDALDYH